MTKAAQEYLQSKGIILPDEKRRYKVVGDVYILQSEEFNYRRSKRLDYLKRKERLKALNDDSRYYNF